MERLNSVLFYSIEKAIKVYRQFAQKQLKEANLNITVDQWLTLKCLYDNPNISQKDLAEMVFKDVASITRIIDLLVNAGFLIRAEHKDDKRKSNLMITDLGLKTIMHAQHVVENYRKIALKGIGIPKAQKVKEVMNAIINNCNANDKD